MADKCIGKLTLDITDVESKIKHIDTLLKSIGAGKSVSLSAKVANEVKKQLSALEKAIKDSISKIQTATQQATSSLTGAGSLQSSIQKVTDETTTMGRSVSGTGATVEKVLGQMRAGYDSLGKKVREFTDENGNITKKIYDETSAFKDAMKIISEYYSKMAQLHALDVGGKKDTPQYTKLLSEVDALNEGWKNIDLSIRAAALRTDEAARAAKLYGDTIKAINAGNDTKNHETALKNLITLYQEYYKYRAQADTFAQKGDIENAEMYNKLADGIGTYITSIARLNPALDAEALATKKVTQAALDYQKTLQGNQYKEQTENIKAYADALTAMLNEQAKFNQQVASGRLKEGTEEYAKAEERLKNLEQAAIQAGQKLDQAGRDAAMGMSQVKKAIDDVNVSVGAINDSQHLSALEQVQNAYNRLTTAIKNYNTAQKANNTSGMSYWKDQIDGSMKVISSIEAGINSLKVDAATRQQILNIIEQCKTAQDAWTKGVGQGAQATGEIEQQMMSLLTRMFSLMAVIRTIKSLIQNTVEYVSEYYDKMNEIQIITQKTDKEVADLADTYRDIAEQMNVSSLDMADAAIYFTRQGLAAEEIEKRLKNVTMYAKTANVEFKDASEIITAVVNSMGLVEQEAEDGRNATQRVADVFLKIGDNAATSGQEIGEAMQKAAASAGAFGVSMEWLASYIAAVSETTRQEARTIGTAFNTIIARLHQIKQSGYNSDDETKVNDIAKALSKVDIVLMDQNNNWRDMEVILEELAGKWSNLDGKTKSYIATTMAGVKQQNVFLALMNDMSKGTKNIEDMSRAYELHALAINSAGTAEEKYATWTDSVTASQERLNVAQEKFYSLLDASVIKDWNNALASWVNNITSGYEATNGLNIIIPVLIAGLAGVVVYITMVNAGLITTNGLLEMLKSHPIIAILSAVTVVLGVLVTTISAVASASETAAERFTKASQALSESNDRIQSMVASQSKLQDMMESLGDKTRLTNDDLNQYGDMLNTISELSPKCKELVDQLTSGFGNQKDITAQLNDEIDELIKNQEKLSSISLFKKYMNWTPEDTSTGSFLEAYSHWLPSWNEGATGDQGFANALKGAWYTSTNYDRDKLINPYYMTQEVFDEVKGLLDSMKGSDYTADEQWGIIGQMIWQEFIGNDTFSLSDSLKKYANETIDDVVNTLGQTMTSAETKALRSRLAGILFGEDGEMDEAEYQAMGTKVAQFVIGVMQNGVKLSDVEIAEAVGGSVFGPAVEGIFAEQGDAFAKAFVDQYNAAIAAGLTDADIVKLFEQSGLPTMELDRIGEIIAEQLQSSIAEALGQDDWLSLVDWNENWDNLDVSTLKLVNDYMNLGISIEEIDELLANSDSPKDFADKLQHLGEEAGIASKDIDDSSKSVTEVSKNIKKEIKTIDSELDKLRKGKKLTFSELVDLSQAHPEILNFINDNEKLQEKIEEIRAKALEDGSNQLKQAMKANADFMASLPEDVDIDEYLDTLVQGLINYVDEAEETKDATENIKTMAAAVRDVKAEISDYDKVIKNLEGGKGASFSDLFDIAEKHPEILEIADNTKLLTERLKELREEARKSGGDLLKDSILDSEKLMASTPYAGKAKTLREYLNSLSNSDSLASQAEKDAVNEYIIELTKKLNELVQATEDVEDAANKAKDNIKEIKTVSSDLKSLDSLYDKVVKNGKASLEDVIAFSDTHPELLTLIGDTDALLKKIQELKQEGLGKIAGYASEAMWSDKASAQEYYKSIGITGNGMPETLKEYRDWLLSIGGNVADVDKYVSESADKIKEAAQEEEKAAETWLEAQMKIAEVNEQVNWAKSNGFTEQVGALQSALDEGGLEKAKEVWDALIPEMQQAIGNEYPNLIKAMGQVEQHLKSEAKNADDAAKAQKNLGKELQNITRYNTPTHFEKTNDAIKKLQEGTISAKDAYDIWADEINKVTKAQEDLNDVNQKLANKKQDEITESDVNNLSNLLGITADQILADFPAAEAMFNALIDDTGELQAAFDALNEAAFVRITGTSVADFSELQNGLISVQEMAEETIELLKATGQWDTEVIKLPQEAFVWDPASEKWIKQKVEAGATVLKSKGNNPFRGTNATGTRQRTNSGKKGSSGGSGQKNNKANEHPQTEVELMLNRMSQVQAIQEYQQSYYQAQGSYYNQTGYLQGVIGASQKEIEVLQKQNTVLKQNIEQINIYRRQKEAELKTLDVSDEKYEEVRDDLDRLQKAHQEYTKQVIDNETAMDQLNETIKETQRKIRDMVINIKQTIYKAIEDREAKNKKMFENEIEMENTILELIKKRYEKERDLILANTDRKIEALQEERDLLAEQLELRKKMADQEDKAAKLAQLEANYARITADPTRMKEARNIKEQIEELRKDIAWDAAENEVQAQQDSIDQQITSLEDYKQYIEEYYEDLFEHPTKLIEEMRNVITRTDDEILEWLMENDETYAAATENTQKQMVDTWQETLDDMHGRIKTYWDEVEEIYKQGDEAIIEFLMENSEEYQKAGKEQAEKYVDEWKQALEDLRKAVAEPIVITIAEDYQVMDPGTSGNSNSGSSGGGSGGNNKKEDHGYSFVYGGKTYAKKGFNTKDEAQKAMEDRVTKEVRALTPASGASYMGEAIRAIQKGATVYAKGGLAYNTGLAWLDGTRQDPERVLSPYQTKLFDTMVQALDSISKISIPSMPNFGNMQTGSSNSVSVGDIIVNVDNLDTDDDYEELADKVSEVLMERIGRTTVVGGLRINAT